MKILYLITGLGLGGAEKVVVDLADQMTLLGHDVKIAYLKGEILVQPVSPKIELICLDFDSLSNFYSALKKYKKVLRDFRPDVVHAHMVHANIFARISRFFISNNKLICSAHNSNEGGYIRMIAYRFTNFLSDLNTNVSNEACISLIRKGAFSKNNIITVYNGIDLNHFKKQEKIIFNNEIKFLSIGRFSEQKDYPNLFHAIALIKNDLSPNVKFYIAGDGELRSELENLIHQLDIGENIQLLGKRNDIPELLNSANFFILASKHEGLPTVVIEAMACETFVIATDCGGCSEIMGDTGRLVPISNSGILADTILDVLKLQKATLTMNNVKARKRIEDNFSLETSLQKWLELYES